MDHVSVLLDLWNMYDSVDRDWLLFKVDKYGIRGVPLNWFTSYLQKIDGSALGWVQYSTVQ